MKKTLLRFSFALVFLLPSFILKSQGWEILFSDTALTTSSFYAIASPSANNGVQIFYQNQSGHNKTFDFDENGDFKGISDFPNTLGWPVFNVDNAGSSYWLDFYKIRKFNINKEVQWVYNASTQSGIFWVKPGPNGSTYCQYDSTGLQSQRIIDVIDADGKLVKRHILNQVWEDDYIPTADLGLVYFNLINSNSVNYVKIDKQGNQVWSKTLSFGSIMLGGDASGNTYFLIDKALVKLGVSSNTIWEKPLSSYHPEISGEGFYDNILLTADGNLLYLTKIYDNSKNKERMLLLKIDCNNGKAIWSKISHAAASKKIENIAQYELLDGGFLIESRISDDAFFEETLLIMRTNKNGYTNPISTYEPQQKLAAQIFPNPAHDRAQVFLKNADAGKILWKIFDSTGRQVATGNAIAPKLEIARNGLAAGLYFCQFQLADGRFAFGKLTFE